MKGYIAQQAAGHPGRLTVIRYAGALCAVAVGVLLASWLQSVLDASVVLLMAILVAAWFSGFWPALLASILATLALDYFFTPPLYTFALEIAHIPHLVVFTLIAGVFVGISAARRRAERALKQARDDLDVKVRERTADLTRANQRLATQYAVTRVLAESHSLDAALPEVLRVTGTGMNWDWGALWKFDREAEVLRCASTWCAPGLVAEGLAADAQLTFALGHGIPGQVWQSGRAQWIPDVAREPGFVRTGSAAAAGLHGATAFPILVGNDTIGVIEFFSRAVRQPDQEELDTLSALGSQIGQVIERRRAEEERERVLVREQAAHAQAAASHQRFGDLVNSIEGIVWEADARTFQFAFVSRQAERVLGYPVALWLEQPTFWKDHIHAEDREAAVNSWIAATTEKRDHDFEYRMVASDGRIVWLRDLVTVVVEDNEATRLRGVMFDITARKQAEQAMREQADLLNLTHDTIFVRDMQDVIRYWNRGAEGLYGWTSKEAVGQVTHALMQTVFPAPLEQITNELLQNGRWEGELVHTRRDGSRVVVASRWSLQRDPEGRPVAILETNNDITERKKAEDRLRRSEATLAEAQRLSHLGSWVENLVDGTLTASPELLRITGYPETLAVTADLLRQRIHPDDLVRVEEIVARSRREKTDFEFEHRIVLPDGSLRHVHSIGHPVMNDSGHIVEIVGTVADVTERKRAEDALRASEEQWRAVFENNPTMYFMVDAVGTVLSVNPFGADQLGYTVDEVIGHSVLKVFAEADWDTVRKTIERCLEHHGQVMSWEIRKVRRDGSVIWVRETAKAMRRMDGSPIVLIACEDITQAKRTEADLRESERRHRHIFQATGVSIWEEDFSAVKAAIDDLKRRGVHDFGKYLQSSPAFIDHAISLVRIIDVNDATLKLFAASSKEELLVSLHKVFTPETRDVFAGELIAIAKGEPSFEGETTLRKLNGEPIVALFTASFPPPDAAFDAVLVSIMDITDRKRAEQELEELAGRLIHAQEQERSRIGRELHDHISQMLAVLTIRMDQLRADEATSPAMAAALEELRQSTAEITNDIHGLSHRLHSSALDYLGLAPALQKLVSEFSVRHGVAIDFEHGPLPAPLPSDVALCLFRVAEESLTNIAKHSHAKSARVQVNNASDGLHLTVEDSGSGFDLDTLERRAGLGFVSMRERLRVLRGTVRVDSAPSRGTKIDVWVPAASLLARSSGEARSSTPPPPHVSSA
jgi:PAS domain S-box-containing protein